MFLKVYILFIKIVQKLFGQVFFIFLFLEYFLFFKKKNIILVFFKMF